MIIDLNAIKRSGKTEESFFFEYDADIEIALPDAELLEPVSVQGTVFIAGNTAEVEGEIVYTLKGSCTRCLADTEKTYAVEFSESFGEGEYPIVNGKIDLTKPVDDIIIMNTPVAFLCRDDCKGLCPECGKNLNEGECKCNNKDGR
ncbi:MAG: DUF177 domain-containing protein [Clostridia bacterium]|nr:DUF177 domain-containing protein [Clostridia bacterium]